MAYASNGSALPSFASLKNLQPSSLIEQVRLGLNSSRPPKTTLDDGWNATYLLYFTRPDDGYVGSAFVVHSERRRDGRRVLDLVTSDHVVAEGCNGPKCANVDVYPNARFKLESNGELSPGNSVPLNAKVKILARDGKADLALLRIVVEGDLDPTPVRLARETVRPGDRIWAIGYPEVYKRKSGRGIEDTRLFTRRWSEGEVTSAVTYTDANTRIKKTAATDRSSYATSADALPGSSGGPMFNDAGEVTCVLRSAGILPDGRLEFAPEEVTPSNCVPVANVRDLLDAAYRQVYAENARPVL